MKESPYRQQVPGRGRGVDSQCRCHPISSWKGKHYTIITIILTVAISSVFVVLDDATVDLT